MNERFAVEPSACDSYFELKHLLEKFGPFTGRYLAAYPSVGWQGLLRGHIETWTPMEEKRAKRRLDQAISSGALVAASRQTYDVGDTWTQNAKRAQRSANPFKGVVVARHSAAGDFVSVEDFEVEPTAEERAHATADEYVRVSEPLLTASRELHFIDPYFNPCMNMHAAVLAAMLRAAAKGKCQCAILWTSEEILNKRTSNVEAIRAVADIAKRSNFLSPKVLRIHAYAEVPGGSAKIHDRYLLCPRGAIRFEHGFQELHRGRTASVVPVPQRTHSDLVALYMEGRHDLQITTLVVPI